MAFQGMKGETVDFTKLFKKITEYYISPKYDGIRGICVNNSLQSYSGKPFRNVYINNLFSDLLKKLPSNIVLDGELINSPDGTGVSLKDFSENIDGIMTIAKPLPNIKYFIFDMFDKENPFEPVEDRYEKLKTYKNKLPEWCIVVEKHIVKSIKEIENYYENFLLRGYEGAVLQGLGLPYKQGRSTALQQHCLKIKPEQDAEAVVIGYIPLYKNQNEQETNELGYSKRSTSQVGLIEMPLLGSLQCKTLKSGFFDEGIVFNVGGGFTMKQREEFWQNKENLIGRKITYRFFEHGIKDAPRQPRFKTFREDD